MSIETPKINWFEGLSPIVKCANCVHWKRDESALWNPEPSGGECKAVSRHGTIDDFYCKYFELNQDINVG